ncbi:MAG: hypothetical protein KAU48_12530, partial [Candidatus Thorarchaeota archaeon]|nr:hypothetical protein [Candidatus Thorarchaeota archaeon]
MNKKRVVFSSLVIVIMLLTPMMVVTTNGDTNATTQQNLNSVEQIQDQDDKSSSPVVYSLNGEMIDDIPDFVYDTEDSKFVSTDPTPFAPAAVDPNKPNLTAIYYQNMTNGDGGWVTWMQPGSTVRIWFSIKGPITTSYPTILVQLRSVISESTELGAWVREASMNNWDINSNETRWFTWDITLPVEGVVNYGWGSGKCNAFTLSLYQPFLVIPPQAFEVFYEGLNSKHSYLHMFGEVYVKSLSWYNYTYDQPIPVMIPCQIAERYWAVFPEFEYYVINAPIWDIELRADMRRDIVWWPD